MKNDMNIIHILFGIVLILLVLIQTYNSVKAESHRQELQQLCDFLAIPERYYGFLAQPL